MKIVLLSQLAIAFAMTLTASFSAFAAEPSFRFVRNHYDYMVNPDGSFVNVVETAVKVLKEDALDSSKQENITYSTSVEKLDIIEAYTQKANGKRINVPSNNFQLEVNSGKDKANPAFSDNSTLTIIFPELAVGDTVVWRYKLTQTEPLFPGHFSEWHTFGREYLYDDVQVKINLPDTLPVRYQLYGMTEKKVAQQPGRKIYEWAFVNLKIVEDKNDWGDIYEFGKDPAYLISSFPSHAAIAQAYGARAKQKAQVTPRIQKLVDEITKGKSTTYGQAKALYEWVAENISYAGNCIGVGAVVPRDTDFVLDNRMGDCKDHATLLEAFLSAKGIQSTQALINSRSIYTLPKIPVVSMVNHVMNYIPSLNLYADATSQDTPFGLLPSGESGKEILLVDGHRDGIKTPVESSLNEKNIVNVTIKIGEAGSAKGKVIWTSQGRTARYSNNEKTLKKYKEWKADPEKVEEYSQSMVKKYGFEGGKISHDMSYDPKQPDVSKQTMDFEVDGFINAGSLGAFSVNPLFSGSSIYSTIKTMKATDLPSSAFICKGDHFEETYIYELPKNLKILAMPDNLSFKNHLVSYQATYTLKDNQLVVQRKLDDYTLGPVCQPYVYQSYKELADKVMPNLKSQVVYKYL